MKQNSVKDSLFNTSDWQSGMSITTSKPVVSIVLGSIRTESCPYHFF